MKFGSCTCGFDNCRYCNGSYHIPVTNYVTLPYIPSNDEKILSRISNVENHLQEIIIHMREMIIYLRTLDTRIESLQKKDA